MHDIEPHYKWRSKYRAEDDESSPFHGRSYSEFTFHNRVYNYLIHPQWDAIGSETLYIKILYVDYEDGYCILECIGEWNDCIENDILTLKNNVLDSLFHAGIYRYILMCEHVLNFHGDEADYYQEWYEDISEEGGWIVLLNTLQHVREEMIRHQVHHYCYIPESDDVISWRRIEPEALYDTVEGAILKSLPHGS